MHYFPAANFSLPRTSDIAYQTLALSSMILSPDAQTQGLVLCKSNQCYLCIMQTKMQFASSEQWYIKYQDLFVCVPLSRHCQCCDLNHWFQINLIKLKHEARRRCTTWNLVWKLKSMLFFFDSKCLVMLLKETFDNVHVKCLPFDSMHSIGRLESLESLTEESFDLKLVESLKETWYFYVRKNEGRKSQNVKEKFHQIQLPFIFEMVTLSNVIKYKLVTKLIDLKLGCPSAAIAGELPNNGNFPVKT